jgi:hypothetical protein
MDENRKRPAALVNEEPPEQVTLVYRKVNDAHTFTAVEVAGLIIVDPDLSVAFHDGLAGVSEMISHISGHSVSYEADFELFKKKVERQSRSSAASAPVTYTSHVHGENCGVTI